jgi:uncharacterized membrane protein
MLAAIAVLAGPVLAIIALVSISNTNHRVRKLMADTQKVLALHDRPVEATATPAAAPLAATIAAEAAPTTEKFTSKELETDDLKSEPTVDVVSADNWEKTKSPPPKVGRVVKGLQDVESKLASRWFVWVGGAAIALGGLLFVKYAHDNGLIPPILRVITGLAFAGALVWAGERLRKQRVGIEKDYVPAALSAAGIVIAFGVIYAAYALYDLLSAGFCFPALVAVGLGALWLSRRQGPLIAALGLLGSFAAPALVPSEHPSAWGFFAYLLVIVCASLYELRNRDWWWLGFAGLGGGLIWGLMWLQGGLFETSHVVPAGLFALAVAAAATLIPRGRAILDETMGSLAAPKTMAMPMVVAATGFAVMTMLLSALVVTSQHNTFALTLFAIGMAAITGFGWMRSGMVVAPLLAAVFSFGILMVWPNVGFHDLAMDERGFWSTVPGTIEPPRFVWTMMIALLAFVGIGLAGLVRKAEPRPWAGLAAGGAVLFLFGAWARADFVAADNLWAVAGAVLAAVLLGFAWRSKDRMSDNGCAIAVEALLLGAALLLLFALDRLFDGVWFTIAIAVEAAVFAWATHIWPRSFVGGLASALASLAAIRLFVGRDFWDDRSTLPLGNHWPLYGYGIPALLFWQASRWLPADGFGRWRTAFEGVALGLGISLISLELRVLMAGSITRDHVALAEVGAHTVAWLGAAYGLAYRQNLFSDFVSKWGARALLAASGLMLLYGLIGANPVFVDDPLQGGQVFNALWLAYLAPVPLLALIARKLKGLGLEDLRNGVGVSALVLLMAFVTLWVKRQFQEPVMSLSFMSQAESYAVSAAWLVTGLAIFVAGLKLDRQTIRYGGLAVLVLAVLKVFGLDLFELGGLWRIASIIGLGCTAPQLKPRPFNTHARVGSRPWEGQTSPHRAGPSGAGNPSGHTLPCGGLTGKGINYGHGTLYHAPALGSRRPLRPPEASLESQNGVVHLRLAQWHSHFGSVADSSIAASGAQCHHRCCRQGRPRFVRRHQAFGARADCCFGQAVSPVFCEFALARWHADQLEDDFQLDQASSHP